MYLKFIASATIALLAGSLHASEFTLTGDYVVADSQTVENEQWVSAHTIQSSGTFANDLFASSGTDLVLSGIHEGNIWGVAGNEASFSGVSERNIRLAAPTIRIAGAIGGNLMAAANTISIATNAVISGDALLYANQIIIEGEIDGSLRLTAMRTVTVSGKIKGDVHLKAPDIILANEARMEGDLTYTTGKELIPSEKVVTGTLTRIEPETPYSAGRIRKHALGFLAAFITAVPFISLFPMTTAMASLLARKSPLKCLLVGFIAVGVLPFFALISISSAIGFPLGMVVLASWGILVYVSRIVMGLLIGTSLLKTGQTTAGRVLLATATGLAVIYVLTFIPAPVGGIAQLLVIWMGMGSLLLALLQKRRLIIQVPEELKQLEKLKNNPPNPTEESK